MTSASFNNIIDISISLSPSTIVYPGNPPVEIERIGSASGSSWHSTVSMGSHTGTHVDAPAHVFKDGKTLGDIGLSHFVGPCKVIDCSRSSLSIARDDIEGKGITQGDRILLKTNNSSRGYEQWYDDYVFLSGDAAAYLAGQEVSLVGIDYLSVKQKGSADNTPHTHLLSKNIPILEGIDLSEVNEGEYNLLFLPLKLNIDGAPGRAVLIW
jgi:arylformamidase